MVYIDPLVLTSGTYGRPLSCYLAVRIEGSFAGHVIMVFTRCNESAIIDNPAALCLKSGDNTAAFQTERSLARSDVMNQALIKYRIELRI